MFIILKSWVFEGIHFFSKSQVSFSYLCKIFAIGRTCKNSCYSQALFHGTLKLYNLRQPPGKLSGGGETQGSRAL